MPGPLRGDRGFTLLETLVVVFLIAVMTAALLPRLGGGFTLELRNAAKTLAGELQYASQRATSTGRLHRFSIDFDAQRFRLEELLQADEEPGEGSPPTHAELLDLRPPRPSTEFFPIEDDRRGDWRWIDEAVLMEGLVRGDELLDEGELGIAFSPEGAAEPVTLRLVDGNGSRIDLRIVGFTGEVRLIEDPEA